MPRRDGLKKFTGMTRKERKRRVRNRTSWLATNTTTRRKH